MRLRFAAFFLSISITSTALAIDLVKDGKSDFSIVLFPDAKPAERRGAEELQKYIEQMSGAKLPIIQSINRRPDHEIIVGKYRENLKPDPVDGARLGADTFAIDSRDTILHLRGRLPRGTMYACDEFLEQLGVQFLTSTVTIVPKKSTIALPEIHELQSPAFEYRETDFFEAVGKDFSAHLRFNGASHQLDESVGGKIDYFHFVHSMNDLIPEDLFKTHPEYFPLINGKRTNGYVQRCLSNPDVLKLAIANVQAWIKERPDAQIYSVSQNDTGNWCQCDQCKAIAAKYGGNQSGLYLWFVNQVAEQIEKDHPDKLIDTLAYQFTEAPPTGISPRKNVRVRLCPIDCDEAHPYEQSTLPANKAFIEHLRGWGKLTDTLYIWHYNTDFANYLMPFPDFNQFPDTIKLYRKTGVRGIFFEGDYATGGGASFAELRCYLFGKLLWNPDLDANKLVDEWMAGVYGTAAPPMRAWFDLLHAKVRGPNLHLRIYDGPISPLFSPDVIVKGDELFDRAEQLASGNAIAIEYIAKARLGLRYVKLMQNPKPGDDLDRFFADVRKFGITQLREGQPLDEWEKQFRAKANAGK